MINESVATDPRVGGHDNKEPYKVRFNAMYSKHELVHTGRNRVLKHYSSDTQANKSAAIANKLHKGSMTTESSHWTVQLAKKLARNPSDINPYVKKFVQDKENLRNAGKAMQRPVHQGSVPNHQPRQNPWAKKPDNVIHIGAKSPDQIHKPKGANPMQGKKQFRPESVEVNETSPQGWHFIARKILKHKKMLPKIESVDLEEKSPPGWEGTVKHMKKHKEISNPWALSWWMKNKGYTSHK